MTTTISEELLRILARSGRIELIRTLRAYPDRDFTINELSRIARVPTMTTWRAVRDLKKAGLAKTKRVGNATSVTISVDLDKMRTLRLIPGTDPHLAAARSFAKRLGERPWLRECRLFGTIGRGDHAPGDEVDIAVVYDDSGVEEPELKTVLLALCAEIKAETNVAIAPLTVPLRDMSKKGGLASELREKEIIWSR